MTRPIPKGTLVVTGGSNGIGKEILNYLHTKYVKAVSYDVSTSSEQDVRNIEQISTFFSKVLIPQQQNDLVVCAGVFRPVNFIEQTKEDIDFVLDINLKGALYTIQQFLKWHKENNSSCKPNIVIISSISAFYHGGIKNVVYDATKAALSYMVKNLANFECVINAIEPGTIRQTKIGLWKPDFDVDENARSEIEKGQQGDVEKLGNEVTKEDIARVIEYLLEMNTNGAVNGTTITVDGGLTSLRQRF